MAWSSGCMASTVEHRCDNVPGQKWYPAVPSGYQRETAGTSGRQRDTKIFSKEIFDGVGVRRLRPPAAVGAGPHRSEARSKLRVRALEATERRWESCEQFLYLIKKHARPVVPRPSRQTRTPAPGHGSCVFSCPAVSCEASAHLQGRSDLHVRRRAILGGGGNRTRVLRSRNRPSPSAAGIRLSGAALLPAAVPPRNQRKFPQ